MKRKVHKRKVKKQNKRSFIQIWLVVAIPLTTLMAVIFMIGMSLILSFLVVWDTMRISEIAWEAAEGIENQAREDSEMMGNQEQLWTNVQASLNMSGFQMTAVLYDAEGNQKAASSISEYRGHIEHSIYEKMLSAIEMNRKRESEQKGLQLYGNNYEYGSRKITINSEEYEFHYAGVTNSWERYGKSFVVIGCFLLLITLLLSLLIAWYFQRIYRERLEMEQQRRNTTNAMAHDLKTPLMAISGYAQNLLENIHGEKKAYYADTILKNVNEMNGIVENMLELSKLETLGITLNKEQVNLRAMTEQILEQYQSSIKERALPVIIQGEARVEADKKLMKRVLENLISNAVQNTPSQHTITIEMGETQYQITNTGAAILESQLQELWKPFVKGDEVRGGGKGTGIGLAIVKEILEAHSFQYELSSRADSVTVRFCF